MKSTINILSNLGTYNLIENEDLEKFKPLIYGLVFPMIILLLTHSIIAMVSIQTLLFFIQNNIQKDKKKAKQTIKMFVMINLLYGTMMLPFLISA